MLILPAMLTGGLLASTLGHRTNSGLPLPNDVFPEVLKNYLSTTDLAHLARTSTKLNEIRLDLANLNALCSKYLVFQKEQHLSVRNPSIDCVNYLGTFEWKRYGRRITVEIQDSEIFRDQKLEVSIAFGKAIRNVKNLATLNVYQVLRSSSMAAFFGSLVGIKPQNVKLTYNLIDEETQTAIASMLEQMHSLKSFEMKLFTAAGAITITQALTNKPALEELIFTLINIETEEEVTILENILASSPKLRVFQADRCQISDADAVKISSYLNKLKNLQELNLPHNLIGNNGVVAIAAAIRSAPIKKLVFDDNHLVGNIAAVAISRLFKIESLTEVSLEYTSVTSIVGSLLEARKPTRLELKLGGNNISPLHTLSGHYVSDEPDAQLLEE